MLPGDKKAATARCTALEPYLAIISPSRDAVVGTRSKPTE
jgi:hypothetical protein